MNLLLAFADILLFFNPFAKFFKDTIQQEREHRCDDIVVQFRYDATAYAQALLILEQQRANTASVALAATGSKKLLLLARVKRLLTGETIAAPVSQRLVAVLLSAILIGFIGLYNPAKKILAVSPGASANNYTPIRLSAIESQQQFETPAAVTPDPVAKTFESVETAPEDPDTEAITGAEIERSVAGILISETIGDILNELAADPNPLFVSRDASMAFSLNLDVSTPAASRESESALHPFVPSRSFEYYRMEDSAAHVKTRTSAPKPPAPPKPEDPKVAPDWDMIEKEIEAAALTIDLVKLQEELDKALAQIDWMKLHNNDPKQSLETVESNVRKYKIEIARIAREHRERTQVNRGRKVPFNVDSTLPAKRAITVRKTIVSI